ncbi:MAG: HvfC/BufC N-terminal domain-containing protein [Gammaproteobacteria bacterium]
MSGLPELQRSFSAFVWGAEKAMVAGVLQNGLATEQRLAIYRNNTRLGLTEALRSVYPVIDSLVGKDFFDRLCHSYIRRHPPQSACLLTYGDRFPEFLEAYPPVAALPYLPDSARLEWLRHEVFFEADEPGLGASDLADVSPDRYGELRFRLRAAVRFLISRYPALRIWQFNQMDCDRNGVIDLDEGGCRVMVYRTGWTVETLNLDWSQYRFLQGIRVGLALSEAVENTLMEDPSFDVTAMFEVCLSKSIFSHYSLN